MAHIDYYFSVISPFTYLGGTRFEQVAARHGATVAYKPLDIMGLFARTGGTPPKDRHPNRQTYRLQDLRRQAAKAELAMNMKPAHFPTNQAPASYAFVAAQNAGGGDLGALRFTLGRSCWADDLDIAEDAVIKACLTEAGFDKGLSERGLLSGAEEYSQNLEEAVEKGVFGAPFMITDGDERFWGQDKIDELDLHLSGKL